MRGGAPTTTATATGGSGAIPAADIPPSAATAAPAAGRAIGSAAGAGTTAAVAGKPRDAGSSGVGRARVEWISAAPPMTREGRRKTLRYCALRVVAAIGPGRLPLALVS